MKINWFSPLPHVKTDIGHYTWRILPALREHAEVTLWTEQDEWEPDLENYATVRRFHPDEVPWAELNRSDLTFYNVGNNAEFHLSIWKVSRRHSGIVILHDVRLQEFFSYVFRWMDGDLPGYLERMGRYYGPAGRQDAELWWNDKLTMKYMVEHYPLTPMGLENSLGTVVHTRQAYEFMMKEGIKPLALAPLPYPTHERTVMPGDKGGPPYRLIAFGYIHVNRRLEEFLEAWAGMPEHEKSQFRLDIYGQLWDPEHVQGKLRYHGLEEWVRIHGFVDEPVLDAALENAHLAFNLRFPTMGEASGSQLRIWDHALPTVVTQVGMYADIPDDVVAFVRPEFEIEDIQMQLRAFLNDPQRFAEMGERGRKILEDEHSPQAYAASIMEFAQHSKQLAYRKIALDLAERMGTEAGAWLNGNGSDVGYRSVAKEIYSMLL